ncbi:Protein SODIUM POTASSIUM ROOT DEFECTIVE 1 [Heracleum sosnowskyi]|uniref:Protein SODIUM POTASSIUM ROOT DEFECTIVE 1 n=1 Tax=Heracleum sosnowskyi TaxID=360622 RepID=A0AAD8JCU1_9APIA|nr:Protein SODIUM POTASSIUM ROOT DEFECTIVE 1 [Heracleum sosnowskyi]
MDEISSSSTTIRLGSRAIDRYNPIIRDSSRLKKSSQNTTILSSSNEQPGRKSGFGAMQLGRPQRDLDVFAPSLLPERAKTGTSRKKHHIFSKSKENNPEIFTGCVSFSTKLSNIDDKRKSDVATEKTNENGEDTSKKTVNNRMIKKKSSWSCTNPGEFFSPPGSSRYLLTSTHQKTSVNLPDFDPLLPPPSPLLLPADSKPMHNDTPSAASPPSRSSQQVVVVLRVSLHCRGCEKKMRKHLSRMEGVTSFDIDFAAKKLTVVGDVTPSAVLASVSKVKNAQLLTLPQPSSTPTTAASETKKHVGVE